MLKTVGTTTQEPTASVRPLIKRLHKDNKRLVVIGDQKGPDRFEASASDLFSLEDQLKLPFKLAPLFPLFHYARKNMGYLVAFSRKAPVIYETDDDNAPNNNWLVRGRHTEAQQLFPWHG
jgi:hypothetical protein